MGQRVRDYTFISVVVLLFDAVGKLQVFLPPGTLIGKYRGVSGHV